MNHRKVIKRWAVRRRISAHIIDLAMNGGAIVISARNYKRKMYKFDDDAIYHTGLIMTWVDNSDEFYASRKITWQEALKIVDGQRNIQPSHIFLKRVTDEETQAWQEASDKN